MFLPNPLRVSALALAVSLSALAGTVTAAEMPKMEFNGNAEAGKTVVTDRRKGNCLACHMIVGAQSPGSIGPALIAIQTRYPSKEALATQIWDATAKNPDAAMPPFGRHEILTPQEFVDVVEYIWSL
jgi:sulfur-oxidizing protein SoxX